MTRLGEMLCFYPVSLFHSMYCGGSVGLRDDVGIVPYIRVGVCAVHRAWGVREGGGTMWASSPTFGLGRVPFIVPGWVREGGRDDVGIVPYIGVGVRAVHRAGVGS